MKNLHHIFQQHTRANHNFNFFEHLKNKVAVHLLILICWYQYCSPSHDNSLAKEQIVESGEVIWSSTYWAPCLKVKAFKKKLDIIFTIIKINDLGNWKKNEQLRRYYNKMKQNVR
jgi:hypothetical protein